MINDQLLLPDGVPPLTTFYLYLTTGCNLACRHCWIMPGAAGREAQSGQFLDIGLLAAAIAEARPLGLAAVKLTGGEPLLHPRFMAICDLLTATGLPFYMETNGTLLDAELALYLRKQSSLWFVSVSLDGACAATHDVFRGRRGAFTKTLAGIRHLAAAGFRPQIIMCPHRGNLGEVEALVRLAVELGAGSVKFNPVTSSGRGKEMHQSGEALEFDEILQLSHFIHTDLQARYPLSLQLGIPPALLTPAQLAQRGRVRCNVHNILGILGDGQMALCGIGRTVLELCYGALGRVSLRETWLTHPRLLELRREISGPWPGLCGECIHGRSCLMHCVAQNWLDSGRLAGPDSLCAEAAARGLFPASRLRFPAQSVPASESEDVRIPA